MPIQPSTHSQRNAQRGGTGKSRAKMQEETRDTTKIKTGSERRGKRKREREFEVMEQALDPHSVPHPALKLVLSCAETALRSCCMPSQHTHMLLSADGTQHRGSHYMQGEFIVNNICSRRPSDMSIQNIPLMSSEP